MAEIPDKQGNLGETVVPSRTKPDSAGRNTPAGNGEEAGTASKKDGEKKEKPQLGDFKLLKKLGQGGMGEVFLANQVSLDRNVAVKVLSKEMAKKAGFVERFVREARSMAKIDHPNAVKVYAADSFKGYNFVAIEYIDGKSMQDWMDQLGKLPPGDAVHVILCCADALAHAHEMNLIHRDIKPDNILLTKKGVVKVADFGLAKALDDEEMSMTQSGTGLGTPLYMPPEQARNAKKVDHRTDIYALGITLYYFLTGRLPFEGDTVIKLIMAKERGQYPSARKLNPQIPEKLELVVDKMIQKEPNHRYASCRDVIADLERLNLESPHLSFIEGGDAAPTGRSGRTRSRVGSTAAPTPTPAPTAQQRTSAEDAAAQQLKSTAGEVMWFVRYTTSKGEATVKEMTTRQIQQGILSEVFDVKAQAQKKDQQSGFLPLAAYAEFQDLMKKRIAKTSSEVKSDHMKDMYAKIEKEEISRKRWKFLRRLTEDTLGFVWLIVYLVLIVAALYGAYWAIRFVIYPWVVSMLPQ